MPTRPPGFPPGSPGSTDFGPEHQQVVRRIDLDRGEAAEARAADAEYVWFTAATPRASSIRSPSRTSGSGARWDAPATGENFSGPAFRLGTTRPEPGGAGRRGEWSIPIDQLPREGRELYDQDVPAAKRLLAEAGYPNGFQGAGR